MCALLNCRRTSRASERADGKVPNVDVLVARIQTRGRVERQCARLQELDERPQLAVAEQ